MKQTGLGGRQQASPAASHQLRTTMKAIEFSLVLSVLLALAGSSVPAVLAADKPATDNSPSSPSATTPATAAKKPVQQRLAGKVVAIDKYGKTITLEVGNLTYVLQLADATRISRAGKERTLNDVVIGKEVNVTLMLREQADGRVEVSVLSVDLNK